MVEMDVMKYEKMIHKVINKHGYNSKWLDKEDLFQEGCIGVIYAYNSYQENENMKFDTWVFNCINWRILRALRGDIRAKGISFVSTNRPIQNDQEDTLEELIEDGNSLYEYECAEDRLMYKFFLDEFERLLDGDCLDVTRYMFNHPGCTWKEALSNFNISYGRVYSIKSEVYRKLWASAYIRNRLKELQSEWSIRHAAKSTNIEEMVIARNKVRPGHEKIVIWENIARKKV